LNPRKLKDAEAAVPEAADPEGIERHGVAVERHAANADFSAKMVRGAFHWECRIQSIPSTSHMEYSFAGAPATKRTARTAPWANASLLVARCLNSRHSPNAPKSTL